MVSSKYALISMGILMIYTSLREWGGSVLVSGTSSIGTSGCTQTSLSKTLPDGARKSSDKPLKYSCMVCRVWAQSSLRCWHGGRDKTGRTGIFFATFIFAVITRAHGRLRSLPFGNWRFRTCSRGLQILGAIGPMVLAQQARQIGSNRGFVAQSLQSLHQVCNVCIWHLWCTLYNQLVEINAHFMQTMQTLGVDFKHAH
jgi:hypothetical protein